MMKANEQDVQVSAATSRVPAPERRNLVTDEEDSEMMDSEMMDSVCAALPCHARRAHRPSASRTLLVLRCCC